MRKPAKPHTDIFLRIIDVRFIVRKYSVYDYSRVGLAGVYAGAMSRDALVPRDAVPADCPKETVNGKVCWPVLFFAAGIFVPGHMFGWLLEWLWLAATLFAGTFFVLNRPVDNGLIGIPTSLWVTIFGCLTVLSVFSFGLALVYHHIPVDMRDILEMTRFPIYGIIGVIIAEISKNINVSGFNFTIKLFALYSLFCTMVYIFEIPIIFDILESFFYKDAKNLIGLGVIRISFPFENPNFLGFFLIFCLVYFAFFRQNFLFFCICLLLLFFTGSRSAFISIVPILFSALIFYVRRYSMQEIGMRTLIAWLFPVAAAGLVITFWDQLTYFSRLVELVDALEGGGIGNVKTADVRFETVERLLMWFERSPLVGWGPGRALMLDIADNQYVSWLVNWGAIGAGILISLMVALLGNLIMSSQNSRHFIGATSLMMSVLIMIFTGDFLENYRLFFLMLMFLQVFYILITSTSDRGAEVPQRRNYYDKG